MPVLTEKEYYRAAPRESLAERFLVAARDQIFRDFQARMRPSPSDRILDVGVSDVVNAGANFLERCYPHPGKITACGLGKGTEFQIAFPAVGYVRIEPNVRLPFNDGTFDIATSNAVLEHVGSAQNQRFFASELCRVAGRVFVSVPNRLFPIEHHTAIPIAHYADCLFKIACRMTGQSQWAREENLILMTRKRLRGIAIPIGRSAQVGYTGLRLGPFSSNLYLVVQ
jgi:methyltransferase family protein